MTKYFMALDQGTTSSRAIIFDEALKPLASSAEAYEQHYPQNGYGGTMNYPPQIRTVNNTAGFVLAIVSIFTVFIPVVGLGLSIAGFALSVKSKREASKNNNIQGGLVIPGLICSIFSLAIHILLIVFVIINGVAGYMLSQSYDDFNDSSGYYDYYDDYNWDNYGDNGDSA